MERKLKPTPRYAAILKTHFWDDFAQRQLERLKRRVRSGDVFVVVNETGGPVTGIGHPESRIVRITDDSARDVGLAHSGDHTLYWYNNDYQLHLLTRLHGDYDYYLVLEFDVVLNVDADVLVGRLHAMGADFVGQPIDLPLSSWAWRSSCAGVYDDRDLQHWLICFMAFSRGAAQTLFDRRLTMSRKLRDGDLPNWPFSEAAVPTELHLAGLRLVRLDELGPIGSYDWAPPHSEEVVADLPGMLVHPVLDAKRFGSSVMRWLDNPRLFFSPHSPLGGHYGPAALRYALPVLHDRLWQARDFEYARLCLTMMREETDTTFRRFHGLDADNLALGKHAVQSSLSYHSVCDTEACGAVAGVVNGALKFHTEYEHRPWWMVDLGKVEAIGRISVFNRLAHRSRADGLQVFLSADGREWSLVGRHEGPISFGGVDGNPLVVEGRFEARFCRLEAPAVTQLHLDQVQIHRPTLD